MSARHPSFPPTVRTHDRWPGLVLVVTVLLLVGCGGVTELDENAVRTEVEAALGAYLPKLGDAYEAGDASLLGDLAAEKERATLAAQIESNAERGERLRPVLRQMTVDDVNVSRTTVYVSTTEVWDIDRLALGSESVIQSYPQSRFRVGYQLKKDEGRWRVFFRQSQPLDT